MIRVLLVHDTRLLRSALGALLSTARDIETTASSWRNAPSTTRSLRPHVCVVDVDCPGAAGISGFAGDTGLTKLDPSGAQNKHPLLVLANAGHPGCLRQAYEAKALGYVDKDAPPDRLLNAIRQVAKGERFVDDALGYGFLQAAEIPLTKRELSVLTLAAEGASVGDIARRLHLSHGTVRNYMAAITRKTGARNRVDAIRISQSAGWL
ncbi:response regulator transcription factor [Streptomyces zagrosensis]|uniref:Two-component system response regulator DesR n=1 Tax=Streptomyces zagrosensis TaxID=1042984 RepID=A0A7W9UVZ5_9ACTN|nr:two-component system response regulator DesR [Streptomyces zagrosensis]